MKKQDLTQTDIILNHLRKYGSITSWEAIKKYHITRLSAKIYELRKSGSKIESRWVFSRRMFGLLKNKNCQYVRYVYKGQVQWGL